MNRYDAASGRREHIPEPEKEPARRSSPLPPQDAEPTGKGGAAHGPPHTGMPKPPGPLPDLERGLDGILSRLDPARLATEDLLVLAILWLLYRESGEKEMLIALAAYLFL